MTKISCDIIQDILPLYCDDVCSLDSRKMVEEHLGECEVCSNMLHQLKSEYLVSVKEMEENKEDGAILGKVAHSWKRSILKAFLIGITFTAIVLSISFGAYFSRYINGQRLIAVPPEEVLVSGYALSDTQISFRIQPTDGYCGARIDTFKDDSNNLYISIQRSKLAEKLTDGEIEVINYGFNQSEKNCSAVYYGTPDNCILIWKQGDELPYADESIFE